MNHPRSVNRSLYTIYTAAVNFSTSLVLGLVFGSLAGTCAFVIAYSEYKRNWSFSGSAVRMALRTAIVTFEFFALAGLDLPWVFQLVTAR
jgi:hypothetical protein